MLNHYFYFVVADCVVREKLENFLTMSITAFIENSFYACQIILGNYYSTALPIIIRFWRLTYADTKETIYIVTPFEYLIEYRGKCSKGSNKLCKIPEYVYFKADM